MEERLQKILAHAGVASRRQADQLIEQGRVRVNGHVVQQMGVRANPREDTITVDGQRIRKLRAFTYLLLNKPRNVMSTVKDPEGRPTVVDLVGEDAGTRLYPVGRLDFGSEGLLILTNDGEFTRFMTRAGGAAKVYGIKVSGVPSVRTLDRLRRGARIEGRSYAPCEIRTVSEDANSWYEVTLHEGQNRQLRRMFEAAGHRVMRLRRTRIGFLTAPTLAPGKWRHLTAKEVREFYRRYGANTDALLPTTTANPAHGSKSGGGTSTENSGRKTYSNRTFRSGRPKRSETDRASGARLETASGRDRRPPADSRGRPASQGKKRRSTKPRSRPSAEGEKRGKTPSRGNKRPTSEGGRKPRRRAPARSGADKSGRPRG